MFSHDGCYLFRNTATNLEYCADHFEIADIGELEWEDKEEHEASHIIRKWCERYIAAYDYHNKATQSDHDAIN